MCVFFFSLLQKQQQLQEDASRIRRRVSVSVGEKRASVLGLGASDLDNQTTPGFITEEPATPVIRSLEGMMSLDAVPGNEGEFNEEYLAPSAQEVMGGETVVSLKVTLEIFSVASFVSSTEKSLVATTAKCLEVSENQVAVVGVVAGSVVVELQISGLNSAGECDKVRRASERLAAAVTEQGLGECHVVVITEPSSSSSTQPRRRTSSGGSWLAASFRRPSTTETSVPSPSLASLDANYDKRETLKEEAANAATEILEEIAFEAEVMVIDLLI